MIQSTLHSSPAPNGPDSPGFHVGIIMDGNGRWAKRRRLPRPAGHRRGVTAVRATVEAAADPASGIDVLTLYAFSSDNWRRPRREVTELMALLGKYLDAETPRCVEEGIRLELTGRRDRLPGDLVDAVERAEEATRGGDGLRLRIAVDYSGRHAILRAVRRAVEQAVEQATARGGAHPELLDEAAFARLLGETDGGGSDGSSTDGGGPGRNRTDGCRPGRSRSKQGGPAPDVDLVIRTGGEQRLSDFLLWESAYAELHFTPVLWPDFGAANLAAALADFHERERRFGGLLEEAV